MKNKSTQKKTKYIISSCISYNQHYEQSIYTITIMKFSFLLPLTSFRFNESSIEITEPKLSYSLEMIKNTEMIKTNINKILKDICCVIKSLNSINMFHGSLSPTNILFDEDFNMFIDDYCLYNLRSDLLLPLTTYNYSSPEIILRKEINKNTDMFSIGCLMYFLLNGRSMNDGFEKYKIKNIYKNKEKLDTNIKNTNYQLIFNRLIEINPYKRINCDNLYNELESII